MWGTFVLYDFKCPVCEKHYKGKMNYFEPVTDYEGKKKNIIVSFLTSCPCESLTYTEAMRFAESVCDEERISEDGVRETWEYHEVDSEPDEDGWQLLGIEVGEEVLPGGGISGEDYEFVVVDEFEKDEEDKW